MEEVENNSSDVHAVIFPASVRFLSKWKNRVIAFFSPLEKTNCIMSYDYNLN